MNQIRDKCYIYIHTYIYTYTYTYVHKYKHYLKLISLIKMVFEIRKIKEEIYSSIKACHKSFVTELI